MSFVHLHSHSYYSLLDGLRSPEAMVERVKAMGCSALAITDHGVLYGAIDFYKAAKKAGKPNEAKREFRGPPKGGPPRPKRPAATVDQLVKKFNETGKQKQNNVKLQISLKSLMRSGR